MTAHRTADATVSAYDGVSVTASDITVLPVTRALYVGSLGNLTVTMASGVVLTFENIPSGQIMPIQVTQVRSGTTASAIIALY